MLEIDVDDWCRTSLASVLSLWDTQRGSAWRHSGDKADGDGSFRPTVTFNAIVTFGDYGLFGSPYLARSPSVALDVHGLLRTLVQPLQHLKETTHHEGARQLIYFGNLTDALRVVTSHAVAADEVTRQSVGGAVDDITARVLGALGLKPDEGPASLAERLATSPQFSPFLLLYVALLLRDRAALLERLECPDTESRIARLDGALCRYFEREVDRLMARRGIADGPGFDPASLAFAVRGLLLYKPRTFRDSPFFAACVDAIASHQNPDGTWPDGVSARVEENADTMQQPSVKTALTLAQIVFEERMLVAFAPTDLRVLQSAMPALEKSAQYLASSHVKTDGASGWVSDRVRWPNTAETWITALAARFFLNFNLARRALNRAKILAAFSTKWPKRPATSVQERRKLWSSVVEPDSILTPCRTIANEILEPVLRTQEQGQAIVKPGTGGVSFIMFGPPGSGKTYFVSQLAECLGWPVVQLNPGNFVSAGAELIESTASDIFAKLMSLDHAVVFFDECDELFLDRTKQSGGARSILSFVTASMLPKLQDLHDQRSVIFIVATNYLSRIDTAIRRAGRFDHIFLFDRPDAAARAVLFERACGPNILPASVSRAVEASAGLATPEILAYARQIDQDAPPAGSGADYEDWCTRDAATELAASRVSKADAVLIHRRWRLDNLP